VRAARILCLIGGVASASLAFAAPPVRPEVDVARIIAAMDVCLKAPPGRDETFDFARGQGFRDLPKEEASGFPIQVYVPLVRNDVWLRATNPAIADNSGGSCEVTAPVAKGTAYAPIVQALQAKFGQTGELYTSPDKSINDQYWNIVGRHVSASLIGGNLEIFVGMPKPSAAEVAQARSANKKRADEMMAALTAASVPSPAVDFGSAAAACAVALGPTSMDAAKVESLGWSPTVKATSAKSAWVFEQQPSRVRIFLATMFSPAGQCVVDGFARSKGDFGSIADAVKTQVSAVLGRKLKNAGSNSSPNGMSRGQGFLADQLMVSISMQDQANGNSVRVTLMQIDKSKSAFETANAAGMAAQYLPMMAGAPR
jgi:hypothetical protein